MKKIRSNYLSTFYIYFDFDLIIYDYYNLNLFYSSKSLRISFSKINTLKNKLFLFLLFFIFNKI